jgi:selenocysteine-specific elongation factor
VHVIGTAGHVDHGKSSLVERLTGMDPDRFAEEKTRGLTIDLGFAWMQLPSGAEVGIIDVPGHERFIRNMLAGAGGINLCLFVVAANEGWMPQSSEHLAIVDVLGIDSGVVALTKADLVDRDTVAARRDEIVSRTKGTALENYPIVECSSVATGGTDHLIAELDQVLARTEPAVDLGRPRLWVDRVFTIAGAGTVVTGTLAGGSIAIGDAVDILPEGRTARVRSIQSHKKEVHSIGPGNRVALNLAGLDRQGAARGDVVVRPGHGRTTDRIDVELKATSLDGTGAITEKGAHLLYAGSAEVPVRLRLIGSDRIPPGGIGFAQLEMQRPLPLQRGDRFVLRDAGRMLTLGGGRILDPMPEPARKKQPRTELLELLSRSGPAEGFVALVESEGSIDRDDALFRTGLSEAPDDVIESNGSFLSRDEARRREAADEVRAEGLGAEAVKLMDHLDAAGYSPPLTTELRSGNEVVRSLVLSGELVRVGDFHLTRERARAARAKVRDAITERGSLTVAEIKEILGTTRKYAVPLCEWLDETGATVRKGDKRELGPTP